MATTKSFKISQLPEMQQSNIDNNDLFLVSDHTGGKYPFESKKLQVGTYSNYIKTKITDELTPYIQSIVEQVVQDVLPTMLSGDEFDACVRQSLDKISDGKLDDIVLVNGGNADGGGPIDEQP